MVCRTPPTTSVEVLRRRASVWTTNFDELVEQAAEVAAVPVHVLLSGDESNCDCRRGHLVKIHGTLSRGVTAGRSEDVLVPLSADLQARLQRDFLGAHVGVVGYAGADIDLRSGLRRAIETCSATYWFGRSDEEASLHRRFTTSASSGRLSFNFSPRPDLAFLRWASSAGLSSLVPLDVWQAAHKALIKHDTVKLSLLPDYMLSGTVADDLGHHELAREFYRCARLHGPDRGRAARALVSSGIMHGAR